MNMLKVLKLSVLSLLILNNSAFCAPVAGSPQYPVNGKYNASASYLCIIDASNSPSPGYFNTKESVDVGQLTYTPDTAHTFSGWLASLGAGVPNPLPLLSNTVVDPTNSAFKLIETPLQWGSSSGVFNQVVITTPNTQSLTNVSLSSIGQGFTTSFMYKNPANNNNVTTGFAMYNFDSYYNIWKRKALYFNSAVNVKASKVDILGISTDQFGNTAPVPLYNCVSKMFLSQ